MQKIFIYYIYRFYFYKSFLDTTKYKIIFFRIYGFFIYNSMSIIY